MAQTQAYNPESVELLAGSFPRRAENSFAWGNAISYYLGLPKLRGFWPMTSVNENGAVYDLSGQGRTLTNVGPTPFAIASLQSYASFDGATTYLTRATEPGLEITDNLTLGCWANFTTIAGPGQRKIISKRTAAGAANTAYILQAVPATNTVQFYVANGANYYFVTSSNSVTLSNWHFVIGRFYTSNELAVFIDNVKTTNAVGIPAATNNPGGAFQVSGYTGLNEIMDGHLALAFLCNTVVSDSVINALYWLTRPLFHGS